MSELKFGVTLPQFSADPDVFWDGVRRAEAADLDSIWLFDHLWPLSGGKNRPILESWTTLAQIAARTERVAVGTLVTRSALRHPALLARMAATASLVAGGRLIIAIGSGDAKSREENDAFGIPYFGPDDRVDQLAGTVDIVRRHLEGVRFEHRDRFAAVAELPASPGRRCPVWVGGRSAGALEVAGRLADGWNSWASTSAQFGRDAATVIDAAGGRGVELSWGGIVIIGRTDDDAAAKAAGRGEGRLVGGPATVSSRLDELIDAGARHLIATLPDAGIPGSYELFAEAAGRGR
ncbi:MAG: LLM class flavin-dependent oxidoreductase [Actinomycetota bacterium]